MGLNKAHVVIGTSVDTGEFVCDAIKDWWYKVGCNDYPKCKTIFLTSDSGGSNGYRNNIFKIELQKLADELGIEIRISHYPPYTSKWNPIEHRVFPHITRALEGVILTSHEQVKEIIERTTTTKGLTVTASIIDKVYETGKKITEEVKDSIELIKDKVLGHLNYSAYAPA